MVVKAKSEERKENETLEAEIEQLRGELQVVNDRLAVEQANGIDARRRAGEANNIYVFDDDDDAREAFDAFFGAPDPHLDKVRGFLLD